MIKSHLNEITIDQMLTIVYSGIFDELLETNQYSVEDGVIYAHTDAD